ncbi:MAG: response regulator [Fibrobacteria bacterium]
MQKRIIIIDDSIFLVNQLTVFLEAVLGHTVVATGNDGNQAVALYEKHKPDLITLDITMPVMDGVEALGEILVRHPAANVMMISAVRGPEMAKCLKMGAKTYMEKPLLFNDEQFVEDFKETLAEIFDN